MTSTAAIARTAIRLSRIAMAPVHQDQIDHLIASAIDGAIVSGTPLDDPMVDARYAWSLRSISYYIQGYARVLPSHDRTRISALAAASTPPDDLVAIDRAGWSSTGDIADYVDQGRSLRITRSGSGWTVSALTDCGTGWRIVRRDLPAVEDALDILSAPPLARAA